MTIAEAIEGKLEICPGLYTLVYIDKTNALCSTILPAKDKAQLQTNWEHFTMLHDIPINSITKIVR